MNFYQQGGWGHRLKGILVVTKIVLPLLMRILTLDYLVNKPLVRDYWCLKTPVSMYVTSQCHEHRHYNDSLCTNCRFLKTGFVDHIGVLQTPIKYVKTTTSSIMGLWTFTSKYTNFDNYLCRHVGCARNGWSDVQTPPPPPLNSNLTFWT